MSVVFDIYCRTLQLQTKPKPLLTIALKILKTIEKPLVPMVGPPKKHSMVMVQLCQNHWKTIDGNGGLKKNINHSIALKNWPSLWSSTSISNTRILCNIILLWKFNVNVFNPFYVKVIRIWTFTVDFSPGYQVCLGEYQH